MLSGLAFILLALIIVAAAGYEMLVGRSQEVATLERRLASSSARTVAQSRHRRVVPVPEMLEPLLARAQLEITTRSLGIGAGSIILAAAVALLLAGPVAAIVVLLLPSFLVLAYVRARARKRSEAMIDALPFYVDGVRQLLTVGNSLAQALPRALADAPAPVQSYLAPTMRRLDLGAPVGEAMQQLADRLQIPEIAMLSAAIRTNLRFGGSMTAVLANLSLILRERLRIKRDLRAATSEVRVSTRVLIAMPIVTLVVIMLANPGYINFFFEDPRGPTMAMVAMGMQAAGMLVMNRMMRLAF